MFCTVKKCLKRSGLLRLCSHLVSLGTNVNTPFSQKCSSSRKLVILFIVSSCYCFRSKGIVSVVCRIVLSKGSKPFMWDLTRAVTSPLFPSTHTRIRTQCRCPGSFYSGTKWYLDTWVPVQKRSTILGRCPCTSARAPSVNTFLLVKFGEWDLRQPLDAHQEGGHLKCPSETE